MITIESLLSTIEGWWITPNGCIIEVPNCKTHFDIACKIFGIEECERSSCDTVDAAETYEMNGAIRLRIYDYLSITTFRWTQDVFERLQNALEMLNLSYKTNICMINGCGKMIKTTVGDIIAANKIRDLD